MHWLAAEELRSALWGGLEIAVIDAREQGAFSAEHLFWGSCVPLSHLETLAADLLPRYDVAVVVLDETGAPGGVGERAWRRLTDLGWSDVSVLAGGIAGWPGERYSGVNVPSKAFGEWVEQQEHTPHLTATELARRQAAGDNLVVLDSRPMREFRAMSIPGGVDCPGAELVYRYQDAAPDPATTIVVNCAGRTRSIIGAQSLRNAGIANPVFALEHGTMGWELAGLTLAHGETTHAPAPSAVGLDAAKAAAARVAARFQITTVDGLRVRSWLADPKRSTFVFDVRSPEEFAASPVAGIRHAPGGQIVQAADEYIGVLGSRVVLADEGSLVRATMTASWLAQLGRYEVYVASLTALTDLPSPAVSTLTLPTDVPTVSADALPANATVVDLADSLRYRRGHIPGAMWAVRARLDQVDAKAPVVLTSPDGQLACLAWADAEALWPGTAVLAGGTAGWSVAGRELDVGLGNPTTTTDDVWYKPYDAQDEAVARRRMQEYLTWEVALLEQIARDELVSFRRF